MHMQSRSGLARVPVCQRNGCQHTPPACRRDLFTRPCAATGRLLTVDTALQLLLPPLVRPYRRVSRARLLAAARTPETLPAYSLRSAPAGTL